MDLDDDDDDIQIIAVMSPPPVCEASRSDDDEDENDDVQFVGEFNPETATETSETQPPDPPSSSSSADLQSAPMEPKLEVPVEPKLTPYSDIDDDEQDRIEAAAAENRASQEEKLLRQFQRLLNSAEDIRNPTIARDSHGNQIPTLPRVIGQNAFNEIARTITSMISRIDTDLQQLGRLPPKISRMPDEFVQLVNKLRQNCGRLVLLLIESVKYKTVGEVEGSKENVVPGGAAVAPEPGPTRETEKLVKYMELVMILDEYLQKKDYKLGWNIFEVIKFRILRILKCSFVTGSSEENEEFDEGLFINVSASLAGNIKKYSRKVRAASVNKITNASDQLRGLRYYADKTDAKVDHHTVNPDGFEEQIEIVRSAVILLSKS